MKMLVAMLLLAAVSQTPASAQLPAASPLLGSWAVDVSRLPIPPEARPKSVTISYTDAGGGRWKTDVEILGGDGSERHSWGTNPIDGTPGPVQGNLEEADSVALKLPLPNVMVMQLAKGGIPASTRVYAVTPDGNSMIETAAYVGPDGKPLLRTNYFTRVR